MTALDAPHLQSAAAPPSRWLARLLPWLVGLLMTAPLWGSAIPPLTDLPGHMSRWQVMLNPDDPFLAHRYTYAWKLVSNLGADVLVAVLGPLIGLEPAAWVLTAACVFLMSAVLVLLSAHVHGQVQPGIIPALTLVHSYPFQFGFVNFWLSQAFALFLFLFWLRAEHWPALRRWLVFGIATPLLWLSHAVAWGLFGVMAFANQLRHHRAAGQPWVRALRAAVVDCLPLAPSALLLLVGTGPSSGGLGFLNFVISKLLWLLSLYRDRSPEFDIGCVVALLFIPVVARFLGPVRLDGRLLWPGLVVLATYLALPFSLQGSWFADMRVLPLALMLIFLSMRLEGEPRRWVIAAGSAFFVVRLAAVIISIRQYDTDYRGQLVALAHLPRHATVMVIIKSECISQDWHISRRQHLAGMATVRRLSFANNQWENPGARTVRVRPDGLGHFVYSSSHLDVPSRCRDGLYSQIDRAMKQFPRLAFDHMWTIGFGPRAKLPPGVELVWTDGQSSVYRRRPAAR